MKSSDPPRVVTICGSLRDASHTRVALEILLDAAADAGADTQLIDLREYDLPVFDPDARATLLTRPASSGRSTPPTPSSSARRTTTAPTPVP